MLYATNAVLFYAATLVLAGAAWRAFGPLAGAGWLAAAVFSPWLQRGMKDIYWCTWTWLLPALAGLAVWALARPPRPRAAVGVMRSCLRRCLCAACAGLSSFRTSSSSAEIPLFAAWAQALAARRPARCWFGRMAGAGFAAVGGVLAALGVWLWQNRLYFGSWGAAWANVLEASTRHTVGGEMRHPGRHRAVCLFAGTGAAVRPAGPAAAGAGRARRGGAGAVRTGAKAARRTRGCSRRWRACGGFRCSHPSAGWRWPKCTARSTPIWCRCCGTSPSPRATLLAPGRAGPPGPAPGRETAKTVTES